MNLEFFIAKRIYLNKEEGRKVSPPAIRIAIAGIAIGLAVMILAVAIVVGFKKEIRAKVIGFGSHIQVSSFDSNSTYETRPIGFSDSLLSVVGDTKGVLAYERFATKPGVLKTDSAFMAIVMKGVGHEFNWNFFKENLVEGSALALRDSSTTNDVIISRYIADKMQLGVGDGFLTYFIQDDVRARKFTVKGIYQTNFTDYDKLFIIGDIHHVQKLNGWKADQVSGLGVFVDDYEALDKISDDLYFTLMPLKDSYGSNYYVRSIKQLNPQIFSWLDLLDMNVWIILILMAVVASFTMISGLMIIILEHTNMIGILKAMGYDNVSLRKVFLYVSLFLIGKGLVWGNVIGVVFCVLQKNLQIVSLNPETYYLSAVPIELNIGYLILLNMATVIISMAILIGPSYLVAKISPSKSIKFE